MRTFIQLVFIFACISLAISLGSCACSGVSITQHSFNLSSNIFGHTITPQFFWFDKPEHGFVVTQHGDLYRVTKDGQQFENVVLPDSDVPIPPFTQTGISRIIKTTNPKWVIFQGFGRLWVSKNAGKTIEIVNSEKPFLQGIKVHPLNPSLLLANRLAGKCEGGEDCYFELLLSGDFGESWNLLDKFVDDFVWGANYHNSTEGSHLVTVFYTKFDKISTTQTEAPEKNLKLYKGLIQVADGWKEQPTVSYTWEMPSTSISSDAITKIIVPNPDNLAYYGVSAANPILFERLDKSSLTYTTLLSTDNGDTLIQTNLPSHKVLKVLSFQNGRIFLHIIEKEDKNYGSLYISDVPNSHFVQAIERQPNFVANGQVDVDWTSVSNVPAFQIANAIDLSNDMYSQFTYDNGETWVDIPNPKDSGCETTDCRLNIFGQSSAFQGPTSNPTAPGIILANGFTGKYISHDNTGVYISRDAGLSWTYLVNDSHGFAIGDRANIIVRYKPYETNSFAYSDNQGVVWAVCEIKKDFLIEFITNIPSSHGLKFLVYGKNENSTQGIVSQLDFTDYYKRDCGNTSKAGAGDSDYEIFVPSTPSSSCVLGQKQNFIRRKQFSDCSSVEDFNTIFSTSICPCTRQDFECNIGYMLTNTGECVANPSITNSTLVDEEPPTHCDSSVGYYVQGPYHYVVGTVCDAYMAGSTAGDYLVRKDCPSTKTLTGAIALTLMIIFSVIGVCITIFVSLYFRSERLRIYLKEKLPMFHAPTTEYTSINDDGEEGL